MAKRKILRVGKRVIRETLFWGLAIVLSIIVVDKFFPTQMTSAGSSPLSSSGIVFYGDTAATGTLRARLFTSPSTWATEFSPASSSASNILHVVSKTAPTREEIMVGHLKVDGRLDILTCTESGDAGTDDCDTATDFTARWNNPGTTATQDCDSTPTLGTCEQAFDIGYEARSGKAMVAYGDNVAQKFYYALWDGSSWSPNSTPGTPGASNEVSFGFVGCIPSWIRVVPAGDNLADDRSNRMMILIADSCNDLTAFYWDGSTFDSGTQITTDLENQDRGRAFDGNWQGNNAFVLSYGETEGTPVNDVEYIVYTVGSGWDSSAQAYTTASAQYFLTSVADPTSSRIYVASSAQGEDTRGAVWRADDATNGWTVCASGGCPDTSTETVTGSQAGVAFERFNGEAFHPFNDAGNPGTTTKSWTYTPSSTWSATTNMGMTISDDLWSTKAWGHPSSDDVMVISSDIDCDLYAQQWNGSSLDTVNDDIEAALSKSNNTCAQTTPSPEGYGVGWGYDFTYKLYSPWQRNWRWFPGSDTASTPSTGTALAAENTAPTDIADGTDLRLRVNYAERARAISNTDARKILQYTSGCNPNTSLEPSCTWTDVDDPAGAGIWRYIDISCTPTDCADNTTLAGTVLTGTSTCSAGLGCGTWVLDKDATGGTNMDHTAQVSADTIQESEWIIEPNGAAGSTTYYFRVYNIDQETMIYTEEDADDCGAGSADCTYPSLTTAAPSGPATEDCLRHCNWFSSGVEQGFFWANFAIAPSFGKIFIRRRANSATK